LLARAAANMPYRRLVSAAAPHEIDIHRSLQVQASDTEVFQLLANFENFPQFMRNIRSVRMNPDGSSRWVAAGPAGSSVKWTSITTWMEPNKVLTWRTLPGSAIEHHGAIHLEPLEDGRRTRVDIRMSYRPPAGALGHMVARLFGRDPRAELEQDMLRLKTFLETGKRPRDAAAQRTHVSGIAAGRPMPGDNGLTVESANQT
jgi:uncharacterized membrane protein